MCSTTQIWVRIPLVYKHVMLEQASVKTVPELLPSVGMGTESSMHLGEGTAPAGAAASMPPPDGTKYALRARDAGLEEEVKSSTEGLANALKPRARDDPWEAWNNLRTMCEHNPNVGVCLELTENLPSNATLAKWYGEPVRACMVPTSIFITNKAGFPVLSKPHQAVVIQLYKVCSG